MRVDALTAAGSDVSFFLTVNEDMAWVHVVVSCEHTINSTEYCSTTSHT